MRTIGELRSCARDIFKHALEAVNPARLIREKVKLKGEILRVAERKYNLKNINNIYLIAIGKASASMAGALASILGERLSRGVVVVKHGYRLPLRTPTAIRIIEAGHPLPDRKSTEAAGSVLRLAARAGKKDLVFCLISGGASALLCKPPEGITLRDMRLLTGRLLSSGADIKEMNTIRKHLSLVHGGRLAEVIYPACIINLIISDVVGNRLNMVSSGPTLPDESTFSDALDILRKYRLTKKLSQGILNYLKRGAESGQNEVARKTDPCFSRCHTVLLGSNASALEAAERRARELGFNTIVLSSSITGEAREVAEVLVSIAREVLEGGRPVSRPACLIAGGETTVTLRGRGLGGRNQELALAAALALEGCSNTVVLSGGTDGTDGPTEVAGAVVDAYTVRRARNRLRLSAEEYLARNDSYQFFKELGGGAHLITGPTQTNVMDIMLALVG